MSRGPNPASQPFQFADRFQKYFWIEVSTTYALLVRSVVQFCFITIGIIFADDAAQVKLKRIQNCVLLFLNRSVVTI